MRLLLVLLALLIACRGKPAGGIDFEHTHEVEFRALAEDAPAVPASDVVIHESVAELPAGLEEDDDKIFAAPGYPSEAEPHRVVGDVIVVEEVDISSFGDEEELEAAWTNDALRAERDKLVAAEAGRHGANAVFRRSFAGITRGTSSTSRRITYHALRLSSAAPAYPSVDELLGRLDVAAAGYVEVRRFTVELEELPQRAPEPIALERGHCYALALAFHPEPIERPRGEVTPIDFVYETPDPVVFPGIPVNDARQGAFRPGLEGGGDGKSWHVLDGYWSRAGVGLLECPVYRTQKASLRFTTFFGSATANPPPFVAGRGTAEIVLFDKKLAPAELTERACNRCWGSFETCAPQAPLAGCAELSECLQVAGVPLTSCRYRKP
jgi:hypothetical protein